MRRAQRVRVRVRGSWSPSFDHTARVCVRVSRPYSTPGAKWPGPVQNPEKRPAGPSQGRAGLIWAGPPLAEPS